MLRDLSPARSSAVADHRTAFVLTSPHGVEWYSCTLACHLRVEQIIPPEWAAPPQRMPVFTLWECIHCAGCGTLLAQPPGRCTWHQDPCPGVDLWLSVPLTRAARALMRVSGSRPLPDLACVLLVEAARRTPDGRWQGWADCVWMDRAMWLP